MQEANKQIRQGGGGSLSALEIQSKKAEIDIMKYRTRKEIDQEEKEKTERRKRDDKQERLDGITGGGGFGNGRFSFNDNNDSDVSYCMPFAFLLLHASFFFH